MEETFRAPKRTDNMVNVGFALAGNGNWKPLFPDEKACDLYERIYAQKVATGQLTDEERHRVSQWQTACLAADQDGQVVPLAPIYTQGDSVELASWFVQATREAVDIIRGNADGYRALAAALSAEAGVPAEYLLTILLCAQTLDVGTLDELHNGIVGQPPTRANTGRYFFWRNMASEMKYSFGVNTYWIDPFRMSMVHSSSVKRTIPRPGAVSIPVFGDDIMKRVHELCTPVCRRLAEAFSQHAIRLNDHLPRCSFRTCSRGDYLCMLFHLGYAHTTEALVEEGVLPAFPTEVDDGWGLWIHTR